MAFFKMPGIRLPHRKSTENSVPAVMDCPSEVCIPFSMNIGAPAVAAVKVGDTVKVGQLIGTSGGYVSAPVHSSVSGKVKSFVTLNTTQGKTCNAAVIVSDGLMESCESLAPPEITDFQSFIKAVTDSGVVGLGGAGFPTSVKLNVKDVSAVKEIIINGAECEPYITSDTRTFLDRIEDISFGVQLLNRFYENAKIIFGIEDNKKQAIDLIRTRFSKNDTVTVKALPSLYPQGGEKVLIYNTVGKIVPEGKLPLDVGVIVLNVTTLAAIANYVKTGMPLTKKCVTVDGDCVKSPKNVIVPIGTRCIDVFEFAGGFKKEPKKIIMGGPMMGHSMPDLNHPVMKNTNALLAFDKDMGELPEETPCINCGTCINSCPLHLDPPAFAKATDLKDIDTLKKLKPNLCMECGVCAYVCPAKRRLVQRNRLAKKMLAESKQEGKNGK